MRPFKKLQVFVKFDPKNVITLYQTPYSPDLSPPDDILFSTLKMKLKELHLSDVPEIQEAVTDELKKVQKEEFSAAFQKLYDRAKACAYANGAYFEWKKVCVFLMGLRFLIKSVLKLLDRTVYVVGKGKKKINILLRISYSQWLNKIAY